MSRICIVVLVICGIAAMAKSAPLRMQEHKIGAADAMQIQNPSDPPSSQCRIVVVSLNPFVTRRVCDKEALVMNEYADLDQKIRAADAMQIQDPSQCRIVIVSLNPVVWRRVCDKEALVMNGYADLDQKMRAADAMQIQDPSHLECTTVIVSLNPFVTKRVCDKTALLDMNEFANAMDGPNTGAADTMQIQNPSESGHHDTATELRTP